MWVNVENLKELLERAENGKLEERYVRAWKDDIERVEEREKARKEKKIRDKIAFYDLIYAELQKATTPLCPTDIQFLIFRSIGREYSCSKIAHGLMAIDNFDSIIYYSGLDSFQHFKGRYKEIERTYTENDNHSYWKIK